MNPSSLFIGIAGGVALLLWALKLVKLGVSRGFGAELRAGLLAGTRNRLSAFVLGAGITTLLQSSMATVLMVSSFAGQGMVSLKASLAIVLGADVGTTIVAQILTFDLAFLVPIFLVIGLVMFSFDKRSRLKNGGRIFIGLALLLLSLSMIREAAAPLKDSDLLPLILKPLSGDPFFSILLAALLTWILHSSLATVLFLMTLASAGLISPLLGVTLVLGANLGGTILPLIATWKDKTAAFRVAASNTAIRFIGVIVCAFFLPWIVPFMSGMIEDSGRLLVSFHMGFNILLAIICLPITGVLGSAVERFIPDRPETENPSRPRYLSLKETDTPSVALAAAERETLRMADYLQIMLENAIKTFRGSREDLVREIRASDNIIDSLYEELKTYMARLSEEFMNRKEAQRYVEILTFATNIEHAGDIIDKNLMPLALKKIRNQGRFSEEGFREIENIHGQVVESVKLAQSVFISGDKALAKEMIAAKDRIKRAEIETSTNHIERLREGVPETIATTSLHLDIIRDLRRVNSYMTTVAYPLLDKKGRISKNVLNTSQE